MDDLLVIGPKVDEDALPRRHFVSPVGFAAIPLDVEATYEFAVIGELYRICDLIGQTLSPHPGCYGHDTDFGAENQRLRPD